MGAAAPLARTPMNILQYNPEFHKHSLH